MLVLCIQSNCDQIWSFSDVENTNWGYLSAATPAKMSQEQSKCNWRFLVRSQHDFWWAYLVQCWGRGQTGPGTRRFWDPESGSSVSCLSTKPRGMPCLSLYKSQADLMSFSQDFSTKAVAADKLATHVFGFTFSITVTIIYNYTSTVLCLWLYLCLVGQCISKLPDVHSIEAYSDSLAGIGPRPGYY